MKRTGIGSLRGMSISRGSTEWYAAMAQQHTQRYTKLIFNNYQKQLNYEKDDDGPGSGLDAAELREG